jgi:CBS domain-containing protein
LADGLRIGDVMEPLPPAIAPGLTVDTFADQLLEGDPPRTAMLVARGEHVVGLVGLAQVRRLRRAAWATTRAEEIMVPVAELPEMAVDAPVWPALLRLREAGLDGAPVSDADGHAGLLTVRAIAAAIKARRPAGGPGFQAIP